MERVQYTVTVRLEDGSEIDIDAGVYIDKGVTVNSGDYNGLDYQAAFDAIADWFEENGRGRRTVNYRLRDWGVSRQRYWGAPIPIIYCDDCDAVPVPEEDLPVVLPEEIEFDGVGSPIKKMPEFYQTTCPGCGGQATRETDTFDTFMESSWYYARYACAQNHETMLDAEASYWTPVDQYVGGIEHAILHLLYARFWHRVLYKLGLVREKEPFLRLFNQGMLTAFAYKDSTGRLVPTDEVDEDAADRRTGRRGDRRQRLHVEPLGQRSAEWLDRLTAIIDDDDLPGRLNLVLNGSQRLFQ